MRKVLKNFFPTRLRFTATKDIVKVDELTTSISSGGNTENIDMKLFKHLKAMVRICKST